MSFQIWLIFFALWNIKGDILKNVGNQIDLATIDFHSIDQKKKKSTRRDFSKYLLLFSNEERSDDL